jgi:outer membrane protein
MKVRVNKLVKMLVLAGAFGVASAASAQSAGQWTASLGVNKITPHVVSGDISAPALPHSQGTVSSDTQPVLVISYSLTDNISFEGALGTPYKHKIFGAGAIEGTGQLGSVEALPPTLFVQYRFFEPSSMVRPFIGFGPTYTRFQKATGSGQMTALTNPGMGVPTTFKLDNKFTYSGQVGVSVAFSERWFATATYIKSKLSTDVHFSSGQQQHMKLDPSAMMVSVGYKF